MITRGQKIVIIVLITLAILATLMIFIIPLAMSLPRLSMCIAHFVAVGYSKAWSMGWIFMVIFTFFLVLITVSVSIPCYYVIDFICSIFSKRTYIEH